MPSKSEKTGKMGFERLLWVFLLWTVSGPGDAWDMENNISPLSYHLCNHTVTRNVTKMVAFQKPYEVSVLCGGWIPWRMCLKKYYKAEYQLEEVPETAEVQQCCRGYERVGHYCAISSDGYKEFNGKPGMCPSIPKDHVPHECTSDFDCPGLLKCCFSSSDSFCAFPVPPALDRNTIKYWYNGTIIIKTEYEALHQLDKRFFNHTRLLHSLITGELHPLEVSVHHLSTGPASMFTVRSQVLIGLRQSLPMMDIRKSMNSIVTRFPEVISIMIEDVDECSHPELSSCLPNETCINLNGSHKCTERANDSNMDPVYPRSENKDCFVFTNHSVSSVTASGFHVQWSTNCSDNDPFRVHVSGPGGFNFTNITRGTYMNISRLAAGELYNVNVSFQGRNGQRHSWTANVKTDAHILNGSLRIVNWNLTEALLNKTSEEYLQFVNKFSEEIKKSLSSEVGPEMLTVKIESLYSGSIIVNFHLIVNDTKLLNNVTSATLSSMEQSSVFAIDPQSIRLTDFNECLSPLDNDCCKYAVCKNLNVSYTCECIKPYSDMNPSRPGRNCQEVIPSPTSLPPTTAFQNPGNSVTSVRTTDSSPTSRNTHYITGVGETSSGFHNLTPSTHDIVSSVHNSTMFNMTTMLPMTTAVADSEPKTTRTASPMQGLTSDVSERGPTVGNTTDSSVVHKKDFLTHSTPENQEPKTSSTGSVSSDFVTHEKKQTFSSEDYKSSIGVLKTMTAIPTHFTSENHHHKGEETSDSVIAANKTIIITNSNTTTGNTHTHNSTYVTVAPHTHHPLTDEHRAITTTTGVATDRYITTDATPKVHTELHFVSQTRNVFPLDMTLKAASNVTCEVTKIGIIIQRAYLKAMSINESSLYLGSPQCTISNQTDTNVSLVSKWEECGTEVHNNKTHTVVNTTLYINLSSTFQSLIQPPKPIGYIRCMFQNEILISSEHNPSKGFFTIVENLHGDGTFTPEFQLYIGDQPVSSNVTLSASDDVKIQIRIKTEDSHFKVVIGECWATPTQNAQDTVSFPFIKESCALANTYTVIHTNGEANNASFQTRIFSLVDNPVVYLHCRLHVCKEGAAGTCKPSCSNVRTARSGENVSTSLARMGPLHQSRRSHVTNSEEHHLGPGYIALIIVCIFAFVAAAVAIMICWHERRTGKYDFKLKCKNVAYRVFSN